MFFVLPDFESKCAQMQRKLIYGEARRADMSIGRGEAKREPLLHVTQYISLVKATELIALSYLRHSIYFNFNDRGFVLRFTSRAERRLLR